MVDVGGPGVAAASDDEPLARQSAPQRGAVLRIKDVWHRRPEYPDQVGGLDIYTAVVDDGVRTPRQFATWLASRGRPGER